jgi:hypothetical protein
MNFEKTCASLDEGYTRREDVPLRQEGTDHAEESNPERQRESCDRHLRSIGPTEKTGEDAEAVFVREDTDVGNPAVQRKNLRGFSFFLVFCSFLVFWFSGFMERPYSSSVTSSW